VADTGVKEAYKLWSLPWNTQGEHTVVGQGAISEPNGEGRTSSGGERELSHGRLPSKGGYTNQRSGK
jgi:hypothetical protein